MVICSTKFRVTEPANYSLWDAIITEASSFKYLETILCSDISWADQVNYTMKGRQVILKGKQKHQKFSLHITNAPDSWMEEAGSLEQQDDSSAPSNILTSRPCRILKKRFIFQRMAVSYRQTNSHYV
jgi:hypothetical protein